MDQKQALVEKVEILLHKNGMKGAKIIFEESKLPTIQEFEKENDWTVEVIQKWVGKALVKVKSSVFSILVWAVLTVTGIEENAKVKLQVTYNWSQEKVYEFIQNPPFDFSRTPYNPNDYPDYRLALSIGTIGTSGTAT